MNYDDLEPHQKNALVAWKIFGWQWIAFDFYDVTPLEHQFWLLPNVMATQLITPGEWTWFLEDKEGDPIGNRIIAPSMIPNYSRSLDDAWLIVDRMIAMPNDPAWNWQHLLPPGVHFTNWFDHAALWGNRKASEVADEISRQSLEIMHIIREDGLILIDLEGKEEKAGG